MTLPHLISGFRELADNYNAILCDVWGVLHNGRDPFAGADTALASFVKPAAKVLLVQRPASWHNRYGPPG